MRCQIVNACSKPVISSLIDTLYLVGLHQVKHSTEEDRSIPVITNDTQKVANKKNGIENRLSY